MAQIFISCASEDYDFANREVNGVLKALGLETWLAPESIRSAELWEKSILIGLESSDWFIVIASAHAASSPWVKKELAWALENLHERIIPIVIDQSDPAEIDEHLSSIQHLDFGGDRTRAAQRLINQLVDAEYRGFQRNLDGPWLCAVQPVYYSRNRALQSTGLVGKLRRTFNSVRFSAECDWHIQDVEISPSLSGYVVDTVPAESKLQWRWNAKLIANSFLVGPWKSKRKSSGSHGFMTVQIARNGTYMFGHDYAVVMEEKTAHYGVLIFGKGRDALGKAWVAMKHARRSTPPLSATIDFPDLE